MIKLILKHYYAWILNTNGKNSIESQFRICNTYSFYRQHIKIIIEFSNAIFQHKSFIKEQNSK